MGGLQTEYVFIRLHPCQSVAGRCAVVVPGVSRPQPATSRRACLWADIVLVSGTEEQFLGRSVQEIGTSLDRTGLDAFLHLHRRFPDALVCYMNQSHPSNPKKVLTHERMLLGSDGHIYSVGERGHHPRAFGAFARFIANRRERKWMSLEAGPRKLTSQAAERFRLPRRGRILPGYHADLCLFRPDSFADNATFQEPNLSAGGMELVFLNGRKAFQGGEVLQKCGALLRAPLQ